MTKKIMRRDRVIGVILLTLITILTIVLSTMGDAYILIEGEDLKLGQESIITIRSKNNPRVYAAYDITISFNPEEVQLLEYFKGDTKAVSGDTYSIAITPEDVANTTGEITAMYVDMTAGEGEVRLGDDDIILLRVKAIKACEKTSFDIECNLVDLNDGIDSRVKTKGLELRVSK